jgi:hypothetical protein
MNRNELYSYIERKLAELAVRINANSKQNLLHLNIHAENFYTHLLNLLFGWNLSNSNSVQQNTEAVDLVCQTNKIVAQVSSTNSKQKIESSLGKDSIALYSEYTFKFISIAGSAENLKSGTFKNPHKIKFTPSSDIIDNNAILAKIILLKTDEIKPIYKYIKDELGSDTEVIKRESNLASIIGILSKVNLSVAAQQPIKYAFSIDEKIDYNLLHKRVELIEDYSVNQPHLDEKYQEFDKQGANKSLSVLRTVRSIYQKETRENSDANVVFDNVIDSIKTVVQDSANYVEIPSEELDLCVKIIVVDAFMRCEIFKAPPKKDATT